ncbi:MAG: alpha-L-rhamnosidase [Firmicutes bacterium]|nr:alpha-L-rhamnosidase [Bacillota bacterium]
MNWEAQWIWHPGLAGEKNAYVCFRRDFDLTNPGEGVLHITADSRYILYVNGQRLGQGPVRSWPFKQHYDSYDLRGVLESGTNSIAVLVMYYGTSTFQYIVGPGGLLCQLDLSDGPEQICIGTDEQWLTRLHPAYDRRTPRMSCQLAYAEHFDARHDLSTWVTATPSREGGWQRPLIRGRVGIEPWVELRPRPIPFLTEEPKYPARILRTRRVMSLPCLEAVDLRDILSDRDRTANRVDCTGLVVTNLAAGAAGQAILHHTGGIDGVVKLNGEIIEFVQDEAPVELQAGDNLLIFNVSGTWHDLLLAVAVDAEFEVELQYPLRPQDPDLGVWAVGKDSLRSQVWETASIDALRQVPGIGDYLHPVPACDRHSDEVLLRTKTQKAIEGPVYIEDWQHLCAATRSETVIHPAENGDLEILLDFGQELVGYLEFELVAPEGVILDWSLFEGIQEGRLLHTDGLRNTLRYVTSAGPQKFHSVVRRGFRYGLLTLRNLHEPLIIRGIRCLLNTYPVVESGRFRCSDEKLNAIWRLGQYTTRLCMEDTYVDCPAYEQAFWVGDARNEGLIAFAAFADARLTRFCLELVADSLHRSPLPESQVPSGWQNILTGWALLWMLACEEYHLYTGDLALLEEIYPALAATCRSFQDYINFDGLLEIEAWNMLDWAPMDTPSSGIVTHQNAWLVRAWRHTAQAARLLGHPDDAQAWEKQAEQLKEAINRHLWSEKDQAFIDCIYSDGTRSSVISQQTNTVIYLCDCAWPKRQEIVAGYVKEVPAGWVQVGSPFMMFFTFEALARQGDFDTILRLVREKWGFMLAQDATTCWEVFPGWHEERWTRSHCHAWSAAPTYFLSAYQLGVRPLEAGLHKVLIAPEPVDLDWCQGAFPTPRGEIEVNWQRIRASQQSGSNEQVCFRLQASLPRDTEARIVLPQVSGEHSPRILTGHVLDMQRAAGRWQLEVAPDQEVVIEIQS